MSSMVGRLAVASGTLLLAAAVLVPATTAAGPASATQAKAKVKVTASASAVELGASVALKVKIKSAPASAKSIVEASSGKGWKRVASVPKKSGKVSVTPASPGTWRYRAVVSEKHKKVATSKPVSVQVSTPIVTVPLSALCTHATVQGGCTPGSIKVGSSQFSYNVWLHTVNPFSPAAPLSAFTWPGSTSCTSLTLNVAGDETMQAFGDSGDVDVKQPDAPLAFLSVPADRVSTLTVALTGGPFTIRTTAYSNDEDLLINGTATCTTPDGAPR